MFHKNNCDCAPQCDTGCTSCNDRKLFHCHKKSCDTCAPAPTCNTCNDGCNKPKLLDRLHACFHKNKGCDGGCGCDSSCANGSCGGTVINNGTTVIPKAGETITTPPKKMPSNPAPGKEPPAKEVRIDTPPALAPVAPAIQPAPAIIQQPAPAIVPSIDSDLRNPF